MVESLGEVFIELDSSDPQAAAVLRQLSKDGHKEEYLGVIEEQEDGTWSYESFLDGMRHTRKTKHLAVEMVLRSIDSSPSIATAQETPYEHREEAPTFQNLMSVLKVADISYKTAPAPDTLTLFYAGEPTHLWVSLDDQDYLLSTDAGFKILETDDALELTRTIHQRLANRAKGQGKRVGYHEELTRVQIHQEGINIYLTGPEDTLAKAHSLMGSKERVTERLLIAEQLRGFLDFKFDAPTEHVDNYDIKQVVEKRLLSYLNTGEA